MRAGMTAQPAEALDPAERATFARQFERLGETIIAQTLARYGAKRFSYLRKVDRVRLLTELKAMVRR